jgi:hypothetical protein
VRLYSTNGQGMQSIRRTRPTACSRALSLISAWRQRSGRVHRQQPLQLRGKLRRKQIKGAREHCVQCMCVPLFNATSATNCALCTANNLCASLRSCMRAAEQLCRMMLAATATVMRATTQTPPTAMTAVTAWGAAVQSRKKISCREVQWWTVMLMARQQLVLLAMQQNVRTRKHKALARIARTQHGDVRSVQQPRQAPLVWSRTQQTLTRHSQHPSLMPRRTMQTWMHMQILARMQLLRRIQVQMRCRCTGASAPAHADARAALPPGGASKRKRGRPRVAKRARPAGKAGHASAHGPGTYVYDEVQASCSSGLYTCGAVLMPAGYAPDTATYCM